MTTARSGGLHALSTFGTGTRTGPSRGAVTLGSTFGTGTRTGPSRGAVVFTMGAPTPAGPVPRKGGVLVLGGVPLGGTVNQVVPTVQNQSPAPGTLISTAATVSFDLVDNRSFLFVEVQADQGRREVIHDGDNFLDPYLTSIRVPITGGWRYQVRRTGGWIAPPTFRVRVYDVSERGG